MSRTVKINPVNGGTKTVRIDAGVDKTISADFSRGTATVRINRRQTGPALNPKAENCSTNTKFTVRQKKRCVGTSIVLNNVQYTYKDIILENKSGEADIYLIIGPDNVVEVDRSKLVAGYLGQTAILINRMVDSALCGILFIDEAYALKHGENDSFGQEAIDPLVKRVEVARKTKDFGNGREARSLFERARNLQAGRINSLPEPPTEKDLTTLTEADRFCLVATHTGETAQKVNKLVDKAMGGVLFIDEAYSLYQGDNDTFGKEAITTLLKRLEDGLGKFVCIAAGYSKEMSDFISSNSGLESRFTNTMEFEDYSARELSLIFSSMCANEGFLLSKEADITVHKMFEDLTAHKTKNFGNAREARKLFNKTKSRLSHRIIKLKQDGIEPSVFSAFPVVSESHARINYGNCWEITDLGSTNGTTLTAGLLRRELPADFCIWIK